MTTQRTTKAPIEDTLLKTGQQLSEIAYEKYVQGEVSRAQLKQFYDEVSNWSRASERVLETASKLGIQT